MPAEAPGYPDARAIELQMLLTSALPTPPRLPFTALKRMCRFEGRAGWVAWVQAGAPAALRAAVARARGGGEDKGRRFALAGTHQSPLSQAIGRGAALPRGDMA